MTDPVHPDQPYTPSGDEQKIKDVLNGLWVCDDMVLGVLHARDELLDLIASVRRDAQAELAAPATEELRMNAYYFELELTGVGIIDRILSAVATAGKHSHHTEGWYGDGDKPGEVDAIQSAANNAAAAIRRNGP